MNATDFNTKRAQYNALLRSEVGNRIDAVYDGAADPLIGQDDDACNLTYYNADGTHLIAAGNTALHNVYKPVVDGLVN